MNEASTAFVAGATASDSLNTSLALGGQPAVSSGVVASTSFAKLTASQLVHKINFQIDGDLDRFQ